MDSGSLELITGPMFSGKTKELERRLERLPYARKTYIVFKPSIDTLSQDCIESADGEKVGAFEIDPANTAKLLEILDETQRQLGRRIDVVAIDEVQFFGAGSNIPWILDHLRRIGYKVIASGLDLDFKAEPFGCTPVIAALADVVDKLKACCSCGRDAIFSQRLVDGQPTPYDSAQIKVGGKESYEARCAGCFVLPGAPKRF